MNTKLLYLNDTYLFSHNAQLLRIEKDDRGYYALIDQTILYPQGGGQQSDTGRMIITADDGNSISREVEFVSLVEGQVHHYGNFEDLYSISQKNNNVELIVDENNRIKNAKLHTAGHLIASITENLKPGLKAVKGFHFQKGSYVSFEKFENAPEFNFDSLLTELQNEVSKAVEKGLNVFSKIVSYEELRNICKTLPENLPKDKPLRIVEIESFPPIPCGGTHIQSLRELQNVHVKKITSKKGEIKISYEIR